MNLFYFYTMNRRFLILGFLLITTVANLKAQQTCNLHIVTSPNNQMQGFPFQVTVNGTLYKLKAGHCLELKLVTDSIHVTLKDKRWVNKETMDVHTKAETDVYVRVFWGWKLEEKKKLRCIAELICKSCFDEYKAKCKKELTE